MLLCYYYDFATSQHHTVLEAIPQGDGIGRKASSIRQTTLVSHGRVQNRELVLSSSKILPKEGLDKAPRLPPTPPLSAHTPLAKIDGFPLFFFCFFCFFNFFRFFGILVRVCLQIASKNSSRRPQEPPRRPKSTPRQPQEDQNDPQDDEK